MAALEFSIYMKKAFDTQEDSCHLGEGGVKPITLSGDGKDEESA